MSRRDSLWQDFRNAKTPHNQQKPTSCPSAPGYKKCAWLLFNICNGLFPSAMVSYSKRRNISLFDKVGRREKKGEGSASVTKNEIARRLDFPFPLLRPRKHGIKYRCRRTHPHFVQTSVYSGPVGRLFRLYDVSRPELEHAGGVVVSGRAEPQPPSRHVDVAQGPRHQRNP